MSVIGKDTSKNRMPERDRINGRIGRVMFAKSRVSTASHNRFPEIDFAGQPHATADTTQDRQPQQPQPSATGARAVSHAMTAAHEQLRTEAGLNVARAIAEPGPVTATTIPSQNPGRPQGATETLSPEQIQHISNAQQMVKRALSEPLA